VPEPLYYIRILLICLAPSRPLAVTGGKPRIESSENIGGCERGDAMELGGNLSNRFDTCPNFNIDRTAAADMPPPTSQLNQMSPLIREPSFNFFDNFFLGKKYDRPSFLIVCS
jgi:hypothetical protein